MNVNGCHIVSKLNADSPDGFLSTVGLGDVLKGPFNTIKEAIAYAQLWKDAANPPPIPQPAPIDPPKDLSTDSHRDNATTDPVGQTEIAGIPTSGSEHTIETETAAAK